MNEASLAKLPRPSIYGLDTAQMEKERKDMWRNLFQKYENLSQTEKDEEEYFVEDIDKPENVSKIFQDGSFSVKANITLRQYIEDHADELDEISTIVGPPASDEEILSDFSDEEILEVEDDSSYNTSVHDLHLESMPDLNTSESDNDSNNDKVISNSENNNILVKYDVYNTDDSDEDILYAPLPPPKVRKKTPEESVSDDQGSFSKGSGKSTCECEIISVEAQNKFNNGDGSPTIEHNLGTEESNHPNDNLVCCNCNNATFYEALEDTESEFICDDCLIGDHRECIEEECETCKEVGKLIEERWNAEVVARVMKQWI